MKKRIWYVLPVLLLLAGLLGPALFAKKNPETLPANSLTATAAGKIASQSKPPETKPGPPAQGNLTKETRPATVTGTKPAGGLVVSIAVVGRSGTLLYGPASVTLSAKSKWGRTVMGALAATGLPYSMSTTWSGFVQSVAGEENRGMSGWMYAVDGKVGPVAATQEPVSGGDEIVWWYSQSMASRPPAWSDLSRRK